MDHYHTWFDLKPGTKDAEFARAMARYMDHLKGNGAIEGWRLSRRKLGFGPKGLGEFHIVMQGIEVFRQRREGADVGLRYGLDAARLFAHRDHVRSHPERAFSRAPAEAAGK